MALCTCIKKTVVIKYMSLFSHVTLPLEICIKLLSDSSVFLSILGCSENCVRSLTSLFLCVCLSLYLPLSLSLSLSLSLYRSLCLYLSASLTPSLLLVSHVEFS